jgi:hypothetical protein
MVAVAWMVILAVDVASELKLMTLCGGGKGEQSLRADYLNAMRTRLSNGKLMSDTQFGRRT